MTLTRPYRSVGRVAIPILDPFCNTKIWDQQTWSWIGEVCSHCKRKVAGPAQDVTVSRREFVLCRSNNCRRSSSLCLGCRWRHSFRTLHCSSSWPLNTALAGLQARLPHQTPACCLEHLTPPRPSPEASLYPMGHTHSLFATPLKNIDTAGRQQQSSLRTIQSSAISGITFPSHVVLSISSTFPRHFMEHFSMEVQGSRVF